VMMSGLRCVGSGPTLVMTGFFVRVVRVDVGPTLRGFGVAGRTGPYPEPVASRGAGAPSEAAKTTCACWGPRRRGANRAVPLIECPGPRFTGKDGFPGSWKVKSG